jgi:3-isopropylmalate/(R)-2-methylmalate dehydratase small subunit
MPFIQVSSEAVVLPLDHVDTDQIIPGRFLTTTQRHGLGRFLFHDWRFDGAGQPLPSFPLNGTGANRREILFVGQNFGCGSSREHAPWALLDFGFRVVIGRGFADIFRRNALGNGLLPAELTAQDHTGLAAALEEDPEAEIHVDLHTTRVYWPGGEALFPVEPFVQQCLLRGEDTFDFLWNRLDAVDGWEAMHPPRVNTLSGAAP